MQSAPAAEIDERELLALREAALQRLDNQIAEDPQSATLRHRRARIRFQLVQVSQSLEDFDAVAQVSPDREAALWDRGIAQYYAGRFADARRQFESHRAVNPHDVENAAWHYLCVARLQGPAAAQDALIPIDTARDRRIPMREIYELFAGRGTPDKVLEAAEAGGGAERDDHRFYAHLYLGLWHEAHSRGDEAKKHIGLAAGEFAQLHYMGDVARVHRDLRVKAEAAKKD